MAALTTLNITEKNANNSLSVTVKPILLLSNN